MLNLARNNEELDLLIHLCCSLTPGIGPTKFSKLKNIFDNPINLLQTDINTLSKVVGDKEARALITNLNSLDLHKLLDSYKKNNITVLSQNSLHYPTRLKEIFNPPICLYVKTNAPMDYFANCLKMNTVLAIVGSRKYTNYGKVATEMIVGELSKHEVTIVSGLALGIDSIAHQSSLKLDVHTCAILGCGVDVIYPNENKYLYESILQNNGAIISEFPPGTNPSKGTFIARNRIISGISIGTIIVEGDKKSGALVTAGFAAEQGRDVFAIPGPMTSSLSQAPLSAIRNGAYIITQPEDVTQYYRLNNNNQKIKNYPKFEGFEEQIYMLISMEPHFVDDIAKKLNIPTSQTISTLGKLEIKQLIEKDELGKYCVSSI